MNAPFAIAIIGDGVVNASIILPEAGLSSATAPCVRASECGCVKDTATACVTCPRTPRIAATHMHKGVTGLAPASRVDKEAPFVRCCSRRRSKVETDDADDADDDADADVTEEGDGEKGWLTRAGGILGKRAFTLESVVCSVEERERVMNT